MQVNASSAQQKTEWGEEALSSRQSKLLAAFALVALSCLFVASVVISLPNRYPSETYFTICGFKNFTGLPCPGCGLTHSFCAVGKGELLNAFAFNALGPPLFLTFILLWIRSACVLLNRSAPVLLFDRMAERSRLVRAFLIAFAVYGAARIVYVLIYYPRLVEESSMLRLVGRLFD